MSFQRDELFHVTIHHHANGMDMDRTFYLRASPDQMSDEETAQETVALVAKNTGIDYHNIDSIVLVRVPLVLSARNELELN